MRIFIFSLFISSFVFAKGEITVGSKPFTEGYILGEIIAQTIEGAGEVKVNRKAGLGATGIIFESLKAGKIDLYPEYTGTISEAILKNPKLKSWKEINKGLEAYGLEMIVNIGFNDTYALAVSPQFAAKHGIKTISDLKNFPEIRAGFTHEFLKRADGFDALVKHYGLQLKNRNGMEHSLAYQSLAEDKIDLVEVYSTDAKIAKYNLQILKDDKNFFPQYVAAIVARKDVFANHPKTLLALKKLEGSINEAKMVELNSKVELDGWPFTKAASFFLNKSESSQADVSSHLWQKTKEHLVLVALSLFLAILIGVPLGVIASQYKPLAQAVLALSGVLQTIPSLALLCFLIPLFGIGFVPAVVALFLYALLPIVRNTYLGFSNIDPKLKESALTLGLTSWDRLWRVDFPLATPAILAGIKLSAVINVGTATLAAFIGAGGYGTFIVTGLALNNTHVILQGAIPSAVLALVIQGIFELADRWLIPAGLRD